MKAIITPTSQVLNATEKCVIVKACAGAGKTTLITSKVQKIIEENPDATIRVLTFNRDAAADDKKGSMQKYLRSNIINWGGLKFDLIFLRLQKSF